MVRYLNLPKGSFLELLIIEPVFEASAESEGIMRPVGWPDAVWSEIRQAGLFTPSGQCSDVSLPDRAIPHHPLPRVTKPGAGQGADIALGML